LSGRILMLYLLVVVSSIEKGGKYRQAFGRREVYGIDEIPHVCFRDIVRLQKYSEVIQAIYHLKRQHKNSLEEI